MRLFKSKEMLTLICVIIGSLVAVGGAFVDYYSKLEDKEEELKKERQRSVEYRRLLQNSNDIINKNNDILQTQQDVIMRTNKIEILQEEVKQKNFEISQLQKNTIEALTGGDNIPVLSVKGSLISTGVRANRYAESIGYILVFSILNTKDTPLKNLQFILPTYLPVPKISQRVQVAVLPEGGMTHHYEPLTIEDVKKTVPGYRKVEIPLINGHEKELVFNYPITTKMDGKLTSDLMPGHAIYYFKIIWHGHSISYKLPLFNSTPSDLHLEAPEVKLDGILVDTDTYLHTDFSVVQLE